MSPLTDIQDNIEKLRSLQESLHDLCAFISTLDLTSGAKEETLIHGITELKEAFANVDLSSVEQAITDVKNAVTNIDFSTLAKESTVIAESQSIKDKIDSIPATDLSQVAKEATLLAKVAELKEALNSINFTAIEQAIQNVEDVTAKEATLIQGVGDIIKAVENIDFTDLENSIAEVKDAVENIDFSALAKEDTLTQGISSVESKVEEVGNKIDNIDLTPIENKVDEGVSTLSTKIDNIDLSSVAKQGENADATNSAIYALLSQFGESVLQEDVTIVCNCAEDIAWEEYGIVITYADGTSQSLPMSENGTCSFSVKIGQEYSVQLPVIGAYIAPTKRTYTASTSSRQIYWSYVVSGVFGLDELGRRYTIEQIEKLEDNSIIKYIGYTDEYLENSPKADGSMGNGIMIPLQSPVVISFEHYIPWSSATGFSTELLPYVTTQEEALKLCDGETYTDYIISEGIRLNAITQAASWCRGKTVTIGGRVYVGFLPAYGQLARFYVNRAKIDRIFSICKQSNWIPWGQNLQSSNNYSEDKIVAISISNSYTPIFKTLAKTTSNYTIVCFNLPK